MRRRTIANPGKASLRWESNGEHRKGMAVHAGIPGKTVDMRKIPWCQVWLAALTALVVAGSISACGRPESGDSPGDSTSAPESAVESAVNVTGDTDVPGEDAGQAIGDDIPYEEVVWRWENDPMWLQRRESLLRDPVLKLSGRSTASDRITALAPGSGRYRTMTDCQLREVLPFFPEIQSLWLEVHDLSDAGLESTRALPYLETLILRGSKDAEGERPRITTKGMAALSHHQRLQQLGLMHLRIDDEAFAQLGVLQSIRILINHRTDLTPRSFQTIAQWPAIRHIGVLYQDWNEPIDQATQRAVASLDGRLSILAFGGDRYSVEGNSTIHPSLIRAISEIRSLTHPVLGDIDHLNPEDLEPLRKLDNLIRFDAAYPHAPEMQKRFYELEREMRTRRRERFHQLERESQTRPRDDRSSARDQPSGDDDNHIGERESGIGS